MNKIDLIDKLSKSCHSNKKETEVFFDALLDLITESLKKGQAVKIANFGVFEPRTRKGRLAVVPGNAQKIKVPSSKTVVFRPSKNLKEDLKTR